MHGGDWIEAKSIIDLPGAANDIEDCMDVADKKYAEFVKKIKNENEDRAELQERSLLLHGDKQLVKLQDIKLNHELHGEKRHSLVKATEGKIAALQERMNIKLAGINKRRKIRHHDKEICLGIIKIE